ncbi:two pore domain potassium channel family protein, partial [Vibrio sp. 2132-1]|nr:two pore domain potassium channel family protein [Vibrio sp. 2132-1]
IQLNPDLDAEVPPDTKLFYIADERIDDFAWKEMNKEQ